MKEKFIAFLKRNKAYRKYISNCNLSEWNNGKIYIIEYFIKELRIYGSKLLSCAFIFEDTPEGDDFWYNLNCKWLKELKAMNNKQ